MSPIDKIFKEIFGNLPSKDGIAYEMLSCIAEHLMNEADIIHDAKIRAEFSKTLYQIDVLSSVDGETSMGEAKDYTVRDKKVGRGDLQKLGGALPDLKYIDKGKLFSATGYTAPAKKYAKAASRFTGNKPIEIFEFRPSTEKDEEGFLKTISIEMRFNIPHTQRGKWNLILTETAKELLKCLIPEGELELKYKSSLEEFYDKNETVILTLHELTSYGYGAINSDTNSAHGSFLLKGHFIKISDILVELKGLEYEIPYTKMYRKFIITDDSEHRFVLKDDNGKVLKFITDEMIRKYSFDDNHNLVVP